MDNRFPDTAQRRSALDKDTANLFRCFSIRKLLRIHKFFHVRWISEAMRFPVIGFALSLALSYGQLIVLPTNLEFVKDNDLRRIYDTIRRLEYDFFVLKEQVVAAGKEGIERGLLNLQQNIDRIAGVMNGNVQPMATSFLTSTPSTGSFSDGDSTQQRIPPVVIKNSVPTRYSFLSVDRASHKLPK
uniref:Uncharacterized protein n=2 Tax=Parascaris TaxID=6254 RepID=A0A914RVQ4_PAREQ